MSTPPCRSCGSEGLRPFLSLGDTPLADALVKPADAGGPEGRYPLEVAFCPGDWNGQNGVTPVDYRAFRNDWSAGGADFNGDQATDMQDYVEFLAAYQAGCP